MFRRVPTAPIFSEIGSRSQRILVYRPLLNVVANLADCAALDREGRDVRVAYFCLELSWLYHFVHELDLIEEDLEASAEVHIIRPGSLMRFSDTHWEDDYRNRLRGGLRRLRNGISLLSDDVEVHSVDQLARKADGFASLQSFKWPVFREHRELNEFSFKGHDCGNAVLSSLIFHTQDAMVDLREHQALIHRALETSILIYLATKTFNRVYGPERVTVFNARMATFRGVLRACQEDRVDCLVHERGATLDRISLTKNTLPHDIHHWQREISQHWPKGGAEEESAREIGESYYQRKRDKQVFNWTVFTDRQKDGLLPEGLEKAEKVYSLFTVSEYERSGLPQYFGYCVHENQLQGILDITQVLKERNFRGVLCIRIHPNSHEEKPSLFEALRRDLNESFVKVIPADSAVDTYALIDASDKVISFGSTVSMEAAFWGKPSVLLGTSEFQHLGSTYQPVDRQDFLRLITSDLTPKSKEGCLKLGYYNSTFGRKLRYSEVFGLQELAFKGRTIQKDYFRQRVIRGGRKIWDRLRGGPHTGAPRSS